MTAWLLDANVLVALRIDTHIHHERSHRWFGGLDATDQFATCIVTQGALLRVHMMTALDRTASAAWSALKEICSHPQHVFWDSGPSYEHVPHRHLQGHRQVTDAWLAELARRSEGQLATLDTALATLHADVAHLIA